jgi:hypothetical protein
MGNVILPSGASVWVEDLNGHVNLSQLIRDMSCDDYTVSYRVSIIAAIAKLGGNGESAVDSLKQIFARRESTNDQLLSDAAEKAIAKIREGGTTGTAPASHTSRNNYSYTAPAKKLDVNDVTFTEIEVGEELHDGLVHFCKCSFCEKMAMTFDPIRKYSDRLAGDKFHCSFCIRNDYYQKNSANVMLLTYKGIFGYYYYSYYAAPKTQSMTLLDIQDYIELHLKVGIMNPIFRYDPDTFTWFVDFNKVGKRKMPVEVVLQTIIEQLACFNIYENVKDASPLKLYEKYKGAVSEFYQHRARTGGKVFTPTLWGCGIPTRCLAGRAVAIENLHDFSPVTLAETNRQNAQRRCSV